MGTLSGLESLRLRSGSKEVDTPESHEPGYTAARNALIRLILHREVEIETKAYDAYGRRVAQVWRLPDYLNVNREMQAYSK